MTLLDVMRKLTNRLASCEYQAEMLYQAKDADSLREARYWHGKANAYSQALEWLSELDDDPGPRYSPAPDAPCFHCGGPSEFGSLLCATCEPVEASS